MEYLKKLGNNIRKRRLELGLTLEELAAITGYSGKAGVSKVECGKANINQSRILAFAKALQTTPTKLMGVNENPITIDRLLSLGFDKEKMENLTLCDIEEIRQQLKSL